MKSTDKSGIKNLIDLLVNKGVRRMVCSPGSRNAPIVIAADLHPQIETIVIHDERVAAFYALGLSLGSEEPVAITCTSGSATVNYFPAITEAYYQNVPLIVLSADRPTEWVNHGEGQTIMQENVFGKHVLGWMNVEGTQSTKQSSDIIELCDKALSKPQGPIHFNCPLQEPLYGLMEYEDETTGYSNTVAEKNVNIDFESLSQVWNESKTKMILCGQMPKSPYLNELLNQIAEDSSVAVLVENTSNLNSKSFIQCIDRTLQGIEDIAEYQPDLLITIGGAIVSKRVKAFLRSAENVTHWKLGEEFPDMDTYRQNRTSIMVSPSSFFSGLLNQDLISHNSQFGYSWRKLSMQIQSFVEQNNAKFPFSDFIAIELALDCIPEGSRIHMANSSIVRYCQLFDPIPSMQYFSNRGVSGIDGSLSTACGVALAQPDKLHVLLTGDVSFFYDSNSLWKSMNIPNLRIILINNSGGGIFRFIPGPSTSSQLEKYFEAHHNHSAEHICKAFNIEYLKAENEQDLLLNMESFYQEGNDVKVMEVFTPRLDNAEVLNEYFSDIKNFVRQKS